MVLLFNGVNNRMKVLFPLDLFYPSVIGGPANTLYWLCKALVKQGYEIAVVTTQKGISEGSVSIDHWSYVDGIKTRYCRTSSKLPWVIVRHSLVELKSADSVVLSSICFIPNIVIAFFAKANGKSIIWSPRGELFESAVKGSIVKRVYFALIRVLFEKRVLFHATSTEEKMMIQRYFPESQVCVIPNYMELPAREMIQADYQDFIYVGRIAPIKALDKLIEGLSQSNSFRNSRSRMMIIGGVESQFREYAKSLVYQVRRLGLENKVHFVGHLHGKEKYRAYASARYTFLVSNSENFGNVVIESLSQGTPVVASKGTPWKVLPSVGAGFWVENSPATIASIVDSILSQPETEYIQFRDNAYNYSKSFDVYEHIDEWERVLR